MHPPEIMGAVDKLQERLRVVHGDDLLSIKAQRNSILLFNIHLRITFASKRVLGEYKLTREAFEWVIDEIESRFLQSLVAPGEMIGCVAAQSIEMMVDKKLSMADIAEKINLEFGDDITGIFNDDNVEKLILCIRILNDEMQVNDLKRNDTGPMMRCSFEETVDILVDAAVYAETDYLVTPFHNGSMSPCCSPHIQLSPGGMDAQFSPHVGRMGFYPTSSHDQWSPASPNYPQRSLSTPLYNPSSPSPQYTPTSPLYTPSSRNSLTTPGYSPEYYSSALASYSPTSPYYTPMSPSYTPVSTSYSPASTSYSPVSPSYSPASPLYSPTSRAYSLRPGLTSAGYSPTSSYYSPSVEYSPSSTYASIEQQG
nr:DNA-directed RNA polymerase II subunit 1 [Tanacetum cinerariifolium]